jgi:hypothetical protein
MKETLLTDFVQFAKNLPGNFIHDLLFHVLRRVHRFPLHRRSEEDDDVLA